MILCVTWRFYIQKLNTSQKARQFALCFLYTVWMISIAHFAVVILLLHHYRRDLAHPSDLYSLVIRMYKSERRAKKNKKWRTSSEPTKFAHFWVVLVRKCMVQKFWISYRFDFFWSFFFRDFLMIPYELFYIIWSRRSL